MYQLEELPNIGRPKKVQRTLENNNLPLENRGVLDNDYYIEEEDLFL